MLRWNTLGGKVLRRRRRARPSLAFAALDPDLFLLRDLKPPVVVLNTTLPPLQWK